jgi:hypothetical protein
MLIVPFSKALRRFAPPFRATIKATIVILAICDGKIRV